MLNYNIFHACRLASVVSEENAIGSSFSGTDVFKLTYLEVGFRLLNLGVS